ncbi:riboflavin synthase [Limosilactobacillus fermentum]|uniref:riboflavin synthase n=1 Tax=Limosilactobacillus fermentum TaxID=1613 RepID=UPI001780206C|nr:riboflavin synthase [Limosilactobacillus fermentum]MBD5807913.1 riboflavin synthase [Limosilactobacillus fermentum]MCE0560643.1 riboflavin synthase [Limosilactobacillus fermentum]
MFSGLVNGTGKLTQIEQTDHTIRLTIDLDPALQEGMEVGASLAVNGTCLTVETEQPGRLTVTLMPQTYNLTTFKDLPVGALVNLERSLKIGDRLEGHIVTGHVDQTAPVIKREVNENAIELTFKLPEELRGQVISQGSVAINGVSLTVMKQADDWFSVGLIPHTQTVTNLDQLRVGDLVNLETDVLGKYVAAQLGGILNGRS